MDHLRTLKILDYVCAALLLLVGVLLVGTTLLAVGLVLASDPDQLVAVLPSAVITLVVAVPLAGEFVLLLFAARGVEHGRGRIPQTIVAVLSLASIPFGTAFGVYSIWVCWVNEETKARFEQGA